MENEIRVSMLEAVLDFQEMKNRFLIGKFNGEYEFIHESINIDKFNSKKFYKKMHKSPSYDEMGAMLTILNKEIKKINNKIEQETALAELKKIKHILETEGLDTPMQTLAGKILDTVNWSLVLYSAFGSIYLLTGLPVAGFISKSLGFLGRWDAIASQVFGVVVGMRVINKSDYNVKLSKEKYKIMIDGVDSIIQDVENIKIK